MLPLAGGDQGAPVDPSGDGGCCGKCKSCRSLLEQILPDGQVLKCKDGQVLKSKKRWPVLKGKKDGQVLKSKKRWPGVKKQKKMARY